jgi:hypothetical protein
MHIVKTQASSNVVLQGLKIRGVGEDQRSVNTEVFDDDSKAVVTAAGVHPHTSNHGEVRTL